MEKDSEGSEANANSKIAPKEMGTAPTGMSFSDWAKLKDKSVNTVRRTIPSVPALSIPGEGGAAIVKAPAAVHTTKAQKSSNFYARRPQQHVPFANDQFTHSYMPPYMGVPFNCGNWRQRQPPFQQMPHAMNPFKHNNPFKNDNMMFNMQQTPRPFAPRPKQQKPRPQPWQQQNQQQRQPTPKFQPQPQPNPPAQLPLMAPPPPPPLPPPPPPPPPSQDPTVKHNDATATANANVSANAKTKSDAKPKKHLTPWRPMPKMPPPIVALTPESKEEKQRLWREYRQAMKPFKNHEFLNAKRVIQRLGKKTAEELDERNLSRLLRAQEFVAAYKQKVSDKAADTWVRAMEEETRAAASSATAETTAGSSGATPAQIYVRKSTTPTWTKPPNTPQHGSGRLPPLHLAEPVTEKNAPISAYVSAPPNFGPDNPPDPNLHPMAVYGGRFILGGQLFSHPADLPTNAVAYT